MKQKFLNVDMFQSVLKVDDIFLKNVNVPLVCIQHKIKIWLLRILYSVLLFILIVTIYTLHDVF